MPSLAPSSKGRVIVNVVSTQHRDCNLVSKNVSVSTEVKYIKTHKIKGHKLIKKGYFKEKETLPELDRPKEGKLKTKK